MLGFELACLMRRRRYSLAKSEHSASKCVLLCRINTQIPIPMLHRDAQFYITIQYLLWIVKLANFRSHLLPTV
jgi:hypothetical protein